MKTPLLLSLLTAGFAVVGALDYDAAVVTQNEYTEQAMIATHAHALDHLTPEDRALLAACARADLDGGADPCASVGVAVIEGEVAGLRFVDDANGHTLAVLAALDEWRP